MPTDPMPEPPAGFSHPPPPPTTDETLPEHAAEWAAYRDALAYWRREIHGPYNDALCFWRIAYRAWRTANHL